MKEYFTLEECMDQLGLKRSANPKTNINIMLFLKYSFVFLISLSFLCFLFYDTSSNKYLHKSILYIV